MAMTKKEREYVANLERQLRLSKALRWTEQVKKDVPPPSSSTIMGRQFTTGYLFNAHRNTDAVYEAWSSTVYHGSGKPPAEGQRLYAASQEPVHLFSTKLLALKALRNEIERMTAEKLADIDERIDNEVSLSSASSS